ncbi:hypothetical protein N9142_04340, partial [Akkermansiaceae bacterium]|nr:hypothetical protein [Akkermansiaceae bacterium]
VSTAGQHCRSALQVSQGPDFSGEITERTPVVFVPRWSAWCQTASFVAQRFRPQRSGFPRFQEPQISRG